MVVPQGKATGPTYTGSARPHLNRSKGAAWIETERRAEDPRANAVYNATGVRVRDLPITPAKLVGRL
jgi:hypothetical protein